MLVELHNSTSHMNFYSIRVEDGVMVVWGLCLRFEVCSLHPKTELGGTALGSVTAFPSLLRSNQRPFKYLQLSEIHQKSQANMYI